MRLLQYKGNITGLPYTVPMPLVVGNISVFNQANQLPFWNLSAYQNMGNSKYWSILPIYEW
jgi:hypothetical protein